MELGELILPLVVSILIGALIGLEREKTKQATKGLSAVGIRTDILVSLFGAIAAFLGQQYHPMLFVICLTALIIFSISSYTYLLTKHGRIGITTEISTILVFLYGAMTMAGYIQLAIILSVVTTLILSVRKALHKVIYKLSEGEIFDTIKFAIIALIILPFLPNTTYDTQIVQFISPQAQLPSAFHQINVLNPYNIWTLVVLISGISFLGYILIKTLGKDRGLSITGLLGGLYSSSATTAVLSIKSKELPQIKNPFLAGITLASATTFIRTFILIRTLSAELFISTLIPLALMCGYLLTVGCYFMFTSKKEHTPTTTKSFETPFKLKNALKHTGYIVAGLVIAKLLLSYGNVNWYYLTAGIISLVTSDDPVIISTSSTAGTLISMEHATNIIIIISYINMLQKVLFMQLLGNKKLVKPLIAIFGGLLLVTLGGVIYF